MNCLCFEEITVSEKLSNLISCGSLFCSLGFISIGIQILGLKIMFQGR